MKDDKQFITLNDSLTLYGIAILLMIFFHCFCDPSRLSYNYFPFISYDFETRISWNGKLCVAIFAFITGYALAKKATHNVEKDFLSHIRSDILIVVKQLIKFYKKFWLVFIIFVPIGIIFFNKGWTFLDIIEGLTCGRGGINAEWWYIIWYLLFMMIFPILDCFLFYMNNKKNAFYDIIISLFLVFLILLLGGACLGWHTEKKLLCSFWNKSAKSYILIFIMAFVLSKYNILEFIDSKYKLPKFVSIIGIISVVLARSLYVTYAAQCNCDVILITFFVFFVTELLHSKSSLNKAISTLKFFGKYSTFMWLTHTFWIYYYFQDIILLPRYSVLIYIWAVAISLANAIVLNYIYNFVYRKIKPKILSRPES